MNKFVKSMKCNLSFHLLLSKPTEIQGTNRHILECLDQKSYLKLGTSFDVPEKYP